LEESQSHTGTFLNFHQDFQRACPLIWDLLTQLKRISGSMALQFCIHSWFDIPGLSSSIRDSTCQPRWDGGGKPYILCPLAPGPWMPAPPTLPRCSRGQRPPSRHPISQSPVDAAPRTRWADPPRNGLDCGGPLGHVHSLFHCRLSSSSGNLLGL